MESGKRHKIVTTNDIQPKNEMYASENCELKVNEKK